MESEPDDEISHQDIIKRREAADRLCELFDRMHHSFLSQELEKVRNEQRD